VNLNRLERLLGADAPLLAAEKISEIICRSTRDIDRKAKLEEPRFGVIVPDCSRENAQIVIQRIEKGLKHIEMEYRGRAVKVEIELTTGIGTYPADGNTAEELMAKAETDMVKNQSLPAGVKNSSHEYVKQPHSSDSN